MTAMEKLEAAKNLRKRERHFFNGYLFYYRIANNKFYRGLMIGFIILAIVFAVLGILGLIGVLTLPSLVMKIAGYGFVICFFSFGLLEWFQERQDGYFRDYEVDQLMSEMYGYLDGLNLIFWKKKYIKKMMKMIKAGVAGDIVTAAKMLKPKLDAKALFFNTDDYKKYAQESIDRVNEKIRQENKEIDKQNRKNAKKARQMEATVAFFNAINGYDSGDSYQESQSYSGSSSSYSSSSDNAAQEAEKRRVVEANRRKLDELKNKASFWERKYYDLLRNDPQCRNYQTKDAEYNMNYFRRQANDFASMNPH